MSARQYIGARYVPKFYDYNGSTEWRSGVAYEGLTIVSRSGNSYTSKKPVPSNIGTPESNPEYWVSTGIYNAQVEEFREVAQETANTVAEQEERLETVEDRVSNLFNPDRPQNMKNCVIIGDSYAIRDTTWTAPLINLLGLTSSEYSLNCGGGIGFARAVDGETFVTKLNDAHTGKTSEFINNVTHIIVCGGANDTLETSANVKLAIASFCSSAKTLFPNAVVYIGFIGNTTKGANVNEYARACADYHSADGNYVYLKNVEYILKESSYMSADGVHPTAEGYNALGKGIWQALMFGCDVQRYHIRYTFNDANNNPVTIKEKINNNLYTLWFSDRMVFTYTDPVSFSGRGAFKVVDVPGGYGVGTQTDSPVLGAAFALLINSTQGANITVPGYFAMINNTIYFLYNVGSYTGITGIRP